MRFSNLSFFPLPVTDILDTFSYNLPPIDSLTRDYWIYRRGASLISGAFNLVYIGVLLIYTRSTGAILHIVSNNGIFAGLSKSARKEEGRLREAGSASEQYVIEIICNFADNEITNAGDNFVVEFTKQVFDWQIMLRYLEISISYL